MEPALAIAGAQKPLVGVLGGMGPLATLDFLEKLYTLNSANADQDNLRLIIISDPTIPDRSKSISDRNAASPAKNLKSGVAALQSAGANFIVIPCNTAHYWYDQMQSSVSIPILNLIQITCAAAKNHHQGNEICVLATKGTILSEIYDKELIKIGLSRKHCSVEIQTLTDLIINLVKSLKIDEAVLNFENLMTDLMEIDVKDIILGCTELSVCWKICKERFSEQIIVIDSNYILAIESIALSRINL